MLPDCFLDTNILFYAALGRYAEPAKYRRARDIVAQTHFAVSGQVLQEFYVTATRKSDKPFTHVEAVDWLARLVDRPCANLDHELVVRGAEIANRYLVSYWDGAILAAAERLGAPVVYTEDLNHGQLYGSVRVVNPFRPA